MRGAVLAEVVGYRRRAGDDGLAALLLAVEQAQRVAFEARAAVVADVVELVAVVVAQDFEVLRAAFAGRRWS